MASNKEILEAQRYNRRRLVTAFMSGTPGGRELEPRSLGRPLVAGLVIAAVLAVERGARIVRVHDVADTVAALKIWNAMHVHDAA